MEENKEQKGHCENCLHYNQYYARQGSQFGIVPCGSCHGKNFKHMHIKNPEDSCELWKDGRAYAAKRKKELENSAYYYYRHMRNVFELLAYDEILNRE